MLEEHSVKGKRVLVTGGLGFIGSNLAHRCLELGARVTIYDCLDPRSGGNMQNVREIEPDLEIVLNDMRNFEGVSAAVRKQDIVFNCAAYTSHPNSMKEPLIDIDVNCKGAINLLEACRRFSAEARVVHVGTSTQIGKMLNNPVDERHPEFPMDIYSANKTACEKYFLVYGSYYRMRTTVVRLANVYGPRSSVRSPDFGFMNYFVGLALQGKEVTVYGDGAQLRNVSYVEDCVSALMLAATNSASEGQVLFATADHQHSVAQIAQAIVRALGGSLRTIEWPKERAAIEIGDAVISNSKIKNLLGWLPKTDLDSGLRLTGDYYRPVLHKYI